MEDTIKHFMDKGLTGDDKEIIARVAEIEADRKDVTQICKREIEKLLKMAGEITQMTHKCKLSGEQRLCTKPAEMRKSWCDNAGPGNIKRLLWMFHQFPWQTHQAVTIKEQTHQDLVEDIVKSELNIAFHVSDEEYDHRKRNCIQQTYSKILNCRKQDIMKKSNGNKHNVQAFIKCQGIAKEKNKRRKLTRSKTQFYWTTTDVKGNCQEYGVRNS